MSNGMHLMIPASEYAEMEDKIEKLEKALDKACGQIAWLWNDYQRDEASWDIKEWKEWCME